jgi:hypothetical protein
MKEVKGGQARKAEKRKKETRIRPNILTFGRDKRCETSGLDSEPFFSFNYSSTLNFSRSHHVSLVAKVFEILSSKKSVPSER